MQTVLEVDLKGLKCPLPVLKARKAMRELPAGGEVKLLTTDPLAVIDIPAFCNENGHELLETQEHDTHHMFMIRKGG